METSSRIRYFISTILYVLQCSFSHFRKATHSCSHRCEGVAMYIHAYTYYVFDSVLYLDPGPASDVKMKNASLTKPHPHARA